MPCCIRHLDGVAPIQIKITHDSANEAISGFPQPLCVRGQSALIVA
ncbi:hypothetical protein [Uliginosibacterium gangwonense]|nr:hypothetical protein [Uliginosibacterium gangwonense]